MASKRLVLNIFSIAHAQHLVPWFDSGCSVTQGMQHVIAGHRDPSRVALTPLQWWRALLPSS